MIDRTVRVLNIVQVLVILTSSGPPFVVFWKLLSIHMPFEAGITSSFHSCILLVNLAFLALQSSLNEQSSQ